MRDTSHTLKPGLSELRSYLQGLNCTRGGSALDTVLREYLYCRVVMSSAAIQVLHSVGSWSASDSSDAVRLVNSDSSE